MVYRSPSSPFSSSFILCGRSFSTESLVYAGLKETSPLIGSLMCLVEPVIAALLSIRLWKEPVSEMFVWGALGVVLLNIPDRIFLAVGNAFKERIRLWSTGQTRPNL